MRSSLTRLVLFAVVFGQIGSAHAYMEELDTDRPGSDFASLTLTADSDQRKCFDRCIGDDRCVAWTFVKAGIQDPNPRCWLKESIPAAKPGSCCVSGVVRRGIGPEINTDRPGGDYSSFDLSPYETALDCRKFCEADAVCVAWTLVLRGVQGRARCWLKDKIPRPQNNVCCVSGVR